MKYGSANNALALDCALTSGGRIVRVNGANSAGDTKHLAI